MDYTIIGSQVNLASRLQSHAEPGGILLSPRDLFAGQGHRARGGARADPGQGIRETGPQLQGVVDQFDTAADRQRVIREEQDGMRIFLDLRKLDKASAVEDLTSILSQLRT